MQVSDISTAIVDAVKDLGRDVLKSATLVGILSDYHAFDTHDSLLAEKKMAINELAKNSYIDKLVKWKKQSKNLWWSEDTQWIEQLCKKQGLKRNVVGMIADAMKEAIGLEVAFTEFSDPKKMLSSEIRKYEAALKKLVTTYTDQLGIKGAFYSVSASTELYRYEGRIKILAQAANDSTYDDKWITNSRKKVIKSLSESSLRRTTIINDTISKGLAEYSQIIEQQEKNGKNGMVIFKKAELDILKKIADMVNYAYHLIPTFNRIDVEKDIKEVKDEVAKYKHQQKVKEDFDKCLIDYKRLLKDNLVIEKDCLGLVYAYYNSDMQQNIDVLRKKITSYAKELSTSYNIIDWLKTEKKRLIDENSTSDDQKYLTASKVIAEDGVAYAEILKEQTILGKKGKKSFEDIGELTLLAARLNRAFEIVKDKQHIDVNNDIETAKTAIKASRRKRLFLITALLSIVLIVATVISVDKINYNMHRVEIDLFNSTIAEGDEALSNGKLVDALNYYHKAKDEYNTDYKLDYYSGIASKKIDEVSYEIYTQYSKNIKTMLTNGFYKCKDAKIKYDELISLDITTDLTSYRSEFEESLKTAVEQRRDNILKSISGKGGKPSMEDIEKIDDLLYCMPDDYYLNLIKSKIK